MHFHRTVQGRAAMVWRRCSVAVDRWHCRPEDEGRGVRLLGRFNKKKIT